MKILFLVIQNEHSIVSITLAGNITSLILKAMIIDWLLLFSLHLNVCISDLWEVMQNMIESRTYKICKIWHR